MELGIMAKTFNRPTLEANLDSVKACGASCIQFDLTIAGLAAMPDQIDPAVASRIRSAMEERELVMSAVSGTFNMIHPDRESRRAGLESLGVIAAACRDLGTSVITLCTGTRDPENMWRRHEGNDAPDAWADMIETMGKALAMAEREHVVLAFEPEMANVINSAEKARKLLDHFQTPHLKVIFDAANLFEVATRDGAKKIIEQALDLLGDDVVIAHAKDRDAAGKFVAAGHGILDYDHYVKSLHQAGFDGPMITHGLTEAQVPGCIQMLRDVLASV